MINCFTISFLFSSLSVLSFALHAIATAFVGHLENLSEYAILMCSGKREFAQ